MRITSIHTVLHLSCDMHISFQSFQNCTYYQLNIVQIIYVLLLQRDCLITNDNYMYTLCFKSF